jgi:hypothetical protein
MAITFPSPHERLAGLASRTLPQSFDWSPEGRFEFVEFLLDRNGRWGYQADWRRSALFIEELTKVLVERGGSAPANEIEAQLQ